MKKTLAVLLSLCLMASLLSGCGKTETQGTPSNAPSEEKGKIVIGVSEPSLGWPYIAAFVEQFNTLLPDYEGVEAIVLSADGSIEKQANDINDLIVQQVDVLLVCSLDGEAVIPALAQASGSGIPILAVSNEPGESGKQYLKAYTGPNDYEQGSIAAQIMLEALGLEPGTEEAANIILIEGTAGQSTTLLRRQGWEDYMAENAKNVKIIDSQPCDWDASLEKTAMQAFLTKYGGDIDGVFSQGGGAATAEVVKDAGYDIPVVCTGLNQNTYNAVKSGLVYGTMSQSPYIDAKQAIELGIKVANGETIEYSNIIPMPIVTGANVSEFEPDF